MVFWLRICGGQTKSNRRGTEIHINCKILVCSWRFLRGTSFGSGTQAPDFWSQSDRFCYLKMYQTRSEKWILMTIELQKNGKENLDFRIYNKKWEYDPNMEEQLKKFRETKWAHFEKTGRKIGRNDPCPCGSGLKYKKCCGR